jgi:ADP-heptose:LPS heptosyltransferase
VFKHLQLPDRRERFLVGLADAGLALVVPFRRGRRRPDRPPRRILLFRLERIGDLIMAWPAIQAVRQLAPEAEIELVTGSWNRDLAALIPGINRITTLDLPWLSRGSGRTTLPEVGGHFKRWRRTGLDLAINFEGDIRSNLLMARSEAARQVGFGMAGGGPVLTDVVPYDPARHVAVNCLRLVAAGFGPWQRPHGGRLEGWPDDEGQRLERIRCSVPWLTAPDAARQRADGLLAALPAGAPIIGVHAGGGRAIKQWPPERFGEAAAQLAQDTGAVVVLTGDAADRPMTEAARRAMPAACPVADLTGQLGLVELAAVAARLSLFLTGDTGPMHVAAAAGAPLVAVFGPSSPDRWGPLSARSEAVRIDLPCAPCNQIRRPPDRCVGRTPDCLAGLGTDLVLAAARRLLGRQPLRWQAGGAPA